MFGNTEAPKTYVVQIDKTAPEAFHQFDPVTKMLQVFGRDSGSGEQPARPEPRTAEQLVQATGNGTVFAVHRGAQYIRHNDRG